ncbi:hypothetical protein FC50_GL000029 [Lacticaseibacillus pantheris DSM 15945 = JCM 12539 = NBRC 106106]|uniref:Uncharacterized protein n=1 Tax=Lacticaseibacillus pantheris DSM 15945 = JCM 12539 = NBRC 106106 TaxID=1423783 RepID=A0A0R1U7Z0_9LACO|nr:hypothetical protein FC50_GL000029 [Lacticaseibacillus pantheris DSM 15945 = JCM 12539 = NBRC 106106]
MHAHINATKLLQITTIAKCITKRMAAADTMLINTNPMLKNVEVMGTVVDVINAPSTLSFSPSYAIIFNTERSRQNGTLRLL